MMDTEDTISSLPDGLLLDIISRIETEIYDCLSQEEKVRLMSTKEVIRKTSIISKRWQHLWTLLPDLIFTEYEEECLRWWDHTKYFSFINKTLTQCPTYVKLNKFKLHIIYDSKHVTIPTSIVNSFVHYAITRNIQEIDLKIQDTYMNYDDGGQFCYDDELFFNNSCITSMKVSDCVFNPPNGVFRWDKLKFLCISKGKFYEDSLEKIVSGSPCLDTLELNDCRVVRRNLKSLFKNFEVIRLSCDIEAYKRLCYDHYNNEFMSMKLLRCQLNPPNVATRWDKLKFLCISYKELDENLIRKIFSRSPCLETLELDDCYGVRRIDISSRGFKNLVLTDYGRMCPEEDYIGTIEINAPYMLSLTIRKNLFLEKLLLLNMSSLVKANLDYQIHYRFAIQHGRYEYDIREDLLRGLLPSLGHVNEITFGDDCFHDLSRLRDKGFQFFRVGANGDEDRVTELIASESKKRADAAAAEKKIVEKWHRRNVDKGESDDDMGLMSLFD